MTKESVVFNVKRSGPFVRVDLGDKDYHVLAMAPANAVQMAVTLEKLNPGRFDFDGIRMKLEVNSWVKLIFSPCDTVFRLSPGSVVDLASQLRSAARSTAS